MRKPTRAELVKMLETCRQYLGHLDVQSIPFAMLASNVIRMIDRATRSK